MLVNRARAFLTAIALIVGVAGATLSVATRAEAAESLEVRMRAQTENTLGGLVKDRRSSFAAAVFVSHGALAFSSTFGTEGPNTSTLISIDSTLFDLNSITKVFTALAIAQLIDRGKIVSIDDPINKYLKHFQLPLAYGHEVTIRQIATHSAGFDLPAFGAGALAVDPARYFERRFPGYFENVGRFSAYENYGPRLLAFMVSEVSGQSFPRYVEESILRPLGMDHTFLVATPRAQQHRYVAFQVNAPANTLTGQPLSPETSALLQGASVSTMNDIAKLIVAMMGPDDTRHVVTQPMRQLMFQVLQSNGARGSAHGLLFDAERNGADILYTHGGIGDGIDCMMVLDVARHAGIFYCYASVTLRFGNNPANSPRPYEEVVGEMTKGFASCAENMPENCRQYPAPAWNDSWNAYLGDYVTLARHHRGFSRLRTLLHPSFLQIERAGQTLKLADHAGFVEIAPGTFVSPLYSETLFFFKDAAGRQLMSTSDRPSAYERPSVLETRNVMHILLAALLLMALSASLIVVLPNYGVDLRVRLAAAGYAVVVVTGVAALLGLRSFGARYFAGLAWPLNIVRVCAFLTIPACVVLIFNCWRIRHEPLVNIARIGRFHLWGLSVSAVLLVITLMAIDLIGFSRIT